MIKVCIGACFSMLLFVVALRTVMFPDYQHKVISCSPEEGIDFIDLTDDHIARFQQAIQIHTISYSIHKTNKTGLSLMLNHIKKSFPALHKSVHVTHEVFNFSSLYKIQGTDDSIKPVLLHGHIDVVPAETEKWSFSPYSGKVDNGIIYGRGTLDNKNTVFGMLEAFEHFIKLGKRLKRTVYIAIGHDEEVLGIYGAKVLTAILKSRGVRFGFMLDEGCVVLKEGNFPGYKGPVGLVGVAEKGYATIELSLQHAGGHASAPPADGGAIDIMADAIAKLRRRPMPHRFGQGVEVSMFEHAAASQSLMYRILSSNIWLFTPIIGAFLQKDDSMRAFISTTYAFTRINGGIKDNVLPNSVHVTINSRLLSGDSAEDVVDHIRKVISDARIDVKIIDNMAASKISSTNSEGYNLLHHTIKQIFPEAIVVPSVLIGATDSRHYGELCDDVYRFAPSYLSTRDVKVIHGHDETITVKNYEQTINFFYHLINNLEKSFDVELHDEL